MTVWTTRDPNGDEVVLKRTTYDLHVLGHEGKDSANRAILCNIVKEVIEKPYVIYKDTSHIRTDETEPERVRYCDMRIVEDRPQVVNIVVECTNPKEVVTFFSSNKLLSYDKSRGGILYVRS